MRGLSRGVLAPLQRLQGGRHSRRQALKLLGVGLNNIEVGANLTCASNEGVKLLY